MKSKIAVFAACVALALQASAARQPASAQTAVSFSVPTACSVSGASPALPNYNSQAYMSTAPTLTVQCNPGTSATISLDNGTHSAACGAGPNGLLRCLQLGTAYLWYGLYTSASYSTIWDATNTVAVTGTGSTSTVTIYMAIPANQTPALGAYSDTVTATLTF